MVSGLVLFLACVHLGYSATPLPLPSYIPQCSKSDPKFDECCLKAARAAIPSIVKGDRKYGYPSLNPLKLDKIELDNYGGLKINLTEVEIQGIQNIKINKVHYDLKAKELHFRGFIDKIVFKSKYNLNGRLRFVELSGTGNMVLDIDGCDLRVDVPYKLITVDREEYFQFAPRNNSVDFTVEGVKVNLDNLFDGNEQLTKNTNELLNAEWRSFYQEIKPAVAKTIETITYSIIDNTSRRVPFKYVFLD